jgi:hypothetical protein
MPSNLQISIDITNRRLNSALPAFTRGDKLDVDLWFFESNGSGVFATANKPVVFSSPTIKLGIGPLAPPTLGSYILKDGAQSTAAINADADAGTIQGAIQAGLTTNWSAAGVLQLANGVFLIDRGTTGSASALTADGANLLPDSDVIIEVIHAGTSTTKAFQTFQLLQKPILSVTSWTGPSAVTDDAKYTGTLDFTGALFDYLLAGAPAATAILEVEVTVSSKAITYLQTPITLQGDTIR